MGMKLGQKGDSIVTHDPKDGTGKFGELFNRIKACKDNKDNCLKLHERRVFYFEPNPETANHWANNGLFTSKIDTSVVFVGESPGPSGRNTEADKVSLCFWNGKYDERFLRIRRKYGLENCYLTNTVKCGIREKGKHDNEEIDKCIHFLRDELELIQPAIVVCIGKNAEHTVKKMKKELQLQNDPFCITHHAFRGSRSELFRRWDDEFNELGEELKRLK